MGDRRPSKLDLEQLRRERPPGLREVDMAPRGTHLLGPLEIEQRARAAEAQRASELAKDLTGRPPRTLDEQRMLDEIQREPLPDYGRDLAARERREAHDNLRAIRRALESRKPEPVEAKPGKTAPERAATNHRAGHPDELYPREEIVRVLLGRRRPRPLSPNALATPEFSRNAVRRVIRLDDKRAFELGSRGGLRVLTHNGEFRPAGKQIALRALERALGDEPRDVANAVSG